jgi:hypothetical protein
MRDMTRGVVLWVWCASGKLSIFFTSSFEVRQSLTRDFVDYFTRLLILYRHHDFHHNSQLCRTTDLIQTCSDNAFGRILITQLPDDPTTTPAHCIANCIAQNYALAGIEFAGM